MRISWMSECKSQGTLNLKRDPFYHGLGYYEDMDGVTWDVHGVIGIRSEPYVQARRLTDSPSYYGTATDDHQYGSHQWLPYSVLVNGVAPW